LNKKLRLKVGIGEHFALKANTLLRKGAESLPRTARNMTDDWTCLPSIRNICWIGLLSIFLGAGAQITAPGWTDWEGVQGGPRLRARLVDESSNAKRHAAAVEVEAQHVWLHTPSPSSEYGVVTAVIQYRVDSNPSVVTPDTRIKFERLSPGKHIITVALLGVGERPISGVVRLVVYIPS
jgi:hypothetical protein